MALKHKNGTIVQLEASSGKVHLLRRLTMAELLHFFYHKPKDTVEDIVILYCSIV